MKRTLTFLLTLPLTFLSFAQDITNGLVSKYTFDQDSIEDVIGNNNGTAEFELYDLGYGGGGKSISFDGYDGSQSATVSRGVIEDSILPFDNDMTISFWFNIAAFNPPQTLNLLSSRRTITGSEDGGIEFGVRGNAIHTLSVAGRSTTGGLTLEYELESAVLSTNQWYFATFVQSGTTKTLYLNGANVDEDFTMNIAEQSNVWAIGASLNGGEAAREFNGKIDDIRFYNRALSSVEVTQLNNLDPFTASINENTIENMKLYPNPTANSFKISSENIEKVNVFDINGTLVEQFDPATNYSVEGLNPGIYIVNVLTSTGVSTHRLVKQ